MAKKPTPRFKQASWGAGYSWAESLGEQWARFACISTQIRLNYPHSGA